jgi:hypothetical protein
MILGATVQKLWVFKVFGQGLIKGACAGANEECPKVGEGGKKKGGRGKKKGTRGGMGGDRPSRLAGDQQSPTDLTA